MGVCVAAVSVGLYSFGCLSLGLIVLQVFRVNRAGTISVPISGYVGSAFAVGQGILGVTWQSIAVINYFTPWVISILLVALLCAMSRGAGHFRAMGRGLREAVEDLRNEGIGWCAVGFFVLVLTAAIIVLTSYPPMEDAQAFYLSLPRLIASTQRFSLLPGYVPFSQIGLGSEMHAGVYYSLVAPLYDEFVAELAAKLNVIPAIVAISLVLWALTSRMGGGRQAQMLAVAMTVSSSMIWMIVLLSKSDIYPALLGVTAVYWLLLAGDFDKPVSLAMAGLLTGLAVSGKISYLVVMGPLLAVVVAWQVWPRREAGSSTPIGQTILLLARRYAELGLWTLVGVAPQILKNVIVFGQPLAPFVVIGTQPNPWLHQTWFNAETTRWIVSTYPLALIYGKYPMQAGTLSPLCLAFAPMILLPSFRKEGRWGENLLLIGAAALSLFLWILLEPSVIAPRYYMPVVMVWIPVAAIAAERALRGGQRRGLYWVVILGTLAVLCIEVRSIAPYARWGWHYVRTTPVNWGREDPVWAALIALNRVARPGERVYLASYWSLQMRPDLIQCSLQEKELEELKSTREDPGRFIAMLRSLGVRYIVQDTLTHADVMPTWDRLHELAPSPKMSRQAFGQNDRILLYTLLPDEEAEPAHAQCLEVERGIWSVDANREGRREPSPTR
jgi:hypothetical protein